MASPRKTFFYKGRQLQAYGTTKPEPKKDPRFRENDGVNSESQPEKQSLASSTNSETKENPPLSQLHKK